MGPVSELSPAFMHLEGFTLEQNAQFQVLLLSVLTAWPHSTQYFPFDAFRRLVWSCWAGYLVLLHFTSWLCFLEAESL